MLWVDARQILGPHVQTGQQRQSDDSPCRMDRQEPEHHPDVAVDMRRASRAGGRVVMDASPLHGGPIPLCRRVVCATVSRV